MQRYKSKYTGPQMDVAFERALPGGAIDQLRQNRNLLDNWDFRNPINQRKATSVTGTYGVDRWRGTYTVNADSITLASNTENEQWIEGTALVGRILTASIITSAGEIGKATFTVGNSVEWFTFSGVSNVSGQQGTYSGNTLFRIFPTANVSIKAAKLELGSVSTLANDPPMDYGAELTRCKRYFNLWASEAARTAALLEVGAMRTTPVLSTIDIGGVTYYTASADL